MDISCVNRACIEYKELKNKTGLSDRMLSAVCRVFLEKYDRFPHLDEVIGADSEPTLKQAIKLKENGSTKMSDIKEYTGTKSDAEATIKLNQEYTDLETEVIQLKNEAIVSVTHRPTVNSAEFKPVVIDENPNNFDVFSNAIEKMNRLYGINIHKITESELNSEEWMNRIPDASRVKGFVYNNEIYINVDRATVDTPIHEMLHLVIGSMRFQNPELYQQLISSVESVEEYDQLADEFRGRSRNDIDEEIFVTQMAYLLTNQGSIFDNIDSKVMHEVMYNIKRSLDTILMGQHSVKIIPDASIASYTLRQLTQIVGSTIMTNNFNGISLAENSSLHRKLNNMKSELIKNKQLKEVCD